VRLRMYDFTPLQLFYSAFRCSVTWTPAGVGVGRVGVGVARLFDFGCLLSVYPCSHTQADGQLTRDCKTFQSPHSSIDSSQHCVFSIFMLMFLTSRHLFFFKTSRISIAFATAPILNFLTCFPLPIAWSLGGYRDKLDQP
jgi:hypothetical protein